MKGRRARRSARHRELQILTDRSSLNSESTTPLLGSQAPSETSPLYQPKLSSHSYRAAVGGQYRYIMIVLRAYTWPCTRGGRVIK